MRKFDIVLFDLGHTLLRFDDDWNHVQRQSATALVGKLIEDGYELDAASFADELRERFEQVYAYREKAYTEYSTEYILTGLLHDHGYTDIPEGSLRPAIDAMYTVSQAHWLLEDDTLPMLDSLRSEGYQLGIISNAGDDTDVQTLVTKNRMREYFDIVLVSAAVGIRKPSPDIFHMALKQWNAKPEQAVMIGDTLNADVLGAHNAGMAGVWITRRGMRPDNFAFQEIVRPDATVETLDALPGLLRGWNGHGPG